VSPAAGELLAVGFEGTALPEDVLALAAESGLGGVVLFARNCPDLDTVLLLTEAARRLGPDVLVLVDHEGGRVHRLPPPFTRFPPAAALGRTEDPRMVAAVARAMARELRAAGFDSGLTPVLDCLIAPDSVAIGDRSYASDPHLVSACGVAFVRAALREGLVPVAKHFPGHGRTALDSHLVLPEVDAPLDELERTELAPVLRGGLGFDGLVLSDDLEMAAVRSHWGVDGAAVRFLEAGGDLALVCRDAAARRATVEAVRQALEAGVVASDAPAAASERRAGLRAWVEQAGPRPDPSVIGCRDHQDLLAEILDRVGEWPRPGPISP
jgi:beta-N-acetylhexosaminidase